jgi:uncharacterized repeat protein (TIGR03803 family)
MKTHSAKPLFLAAAFLVVAVSGGNNLAQAQTLTVIHSFTGNHGDGEYPYLGNLPFDSNGALYGTTSAGGGTGNNGIVFQLVPPTKQGGAWTENVIYTFAGGTDGRTPTGGLVFDQSGNLYGTTDYGGSTACSLGCATVFKLAPPSGGGAWTETILYNWPSHGEDVVTTSGERESRLGVHPGSVTRFRNESTTCA